MPKPRISDADYVHLLETIGPAEISKRYNVNLRNVYARRVNLERTLRRQITVPQQSPGSVTRFNIEHPERHNAEIENGTVVVFSDAHYWPGNPSTAHRGLVKFIKEHTPSLLVANGDVIDGATISRHPKIGWEEQPLLIDEIETAKERLHEIASACPKRTKKVWTLGNHDGRFETRLATVAPEYAKIHGIHLKDHFPVWEPAWSTWVNDNTVIKHRFKGGIHATHNNVLYAGKHTITGHLHQAKVTPFTNYNGDLYGVDTGCIADIYSKAFHYLEDNPRNWRAGFGVLTYNNGRLMYPELVLVWDEDHVQFRGKLIKV